MEKICIELPIVRVEPNQPIFCSDFAKEHYELGLFILDDGVMRHIMHYDGKFANAFPCPNDVVEKHLVEKAIRDNDAIYHRDMEAIEERLKSMSNAITSNGKVLDSLRHEIDAHMAIVNEMWDGVVDDMKENREAVMAKLSDMPKNVGGEGVNILDVAKSFAVIQKPELIKELNK